MTVGVDVGGTFTDVARWDGERLIVAKTSSTADQSDGVEAGARRVLAAEADPLLVHGTTVATNALLERAGVEVVVLTDEGFEDVIEIGRQQRPALYDVFADRPQPLVPRSRRIGVGAAGFEEAAGRVAALQPGAVAVALLHGYARPERDRQALSALGAAGIDPQRVVLAGVDLGEFREFERTSTAVLTAYLRPMVQRYLERLVDRVIPSLARRVLVMRSSGGLMAPAEAGAQAAAILLSGPAGGVVAAARLGEALGHRRVVSFDMGGTSTDVCRIEGGRPEVGYEREIDGYVCRMPSVAVHTVGAGGGSLGWVDAGGALRVGPRSAGAEPGPASYQRGGTEPAVTDANLALGRIAPEARLGGSVPLSMEAAERALAALGARLGLDVAGTAAGMLEVVEAHMGRAVRRVSVEEGADPREAVLIGFGGAGGLHATALARRLEMRGVVIPPFAGVFSALGLLLSPPRRDQVRSVLLTVDDADRLDRAVDAERKLASEGLAADTGVAPAEVETTVDVRYLGQAHETPVPYRAGEGWETLAGRFHRIHRERNGFARIDDPIEAVSVRAAAFGRPALSWDDLPPHSPSRDAARRGWRAVVAGGAATEAEVWWRPGMRPGDEVLGPAVIEEPESTTFLAPGERARLHPSGALEVEW